ncbi:flavin reductase family protein [Streptomyces sp. CA-100214]
MTNHSSATAPAEPLQNAFRDVMANVCTPVSVVTTSAGDLPHGTTVSAFASLSMSPPMVLVSLDCGSELLALIRETGHFGLNVLASDQSPLALAFARKGGPAKFTGISWELDTGVPRLPGATGFLACRVTDFVSGGDHIVVLGEVVTARTAENRPLTYHARVFGTHVALEVSDR